MEELFIDNRTPTINKTDKDNCLRRGVRIYSATPFSACLQIRSHTDKQGVYGMVHLSPSECRELGEWLLAYAEEKAKNAPK